jgi:ribosomal protein S18 acetylase RimI-like enzyme
MKRSRPTITCKFVAGLLFLWLGAIAGFSRPTHVKNGGRQNDERRWKHLRRTGHKRNLPSTQIQLVLQLLGNSNNNEIIDDSSSSPNFFIRPALQGDMGRASQILADGFFKGKVNFLLYQWERLETYLSLEANFPRPNALHQVFVACDGRSGRVLGLAELDVRPTKTRSNRGAKNDSAVDKKQNSTSDGPYMCNVAVDEQYQRQGIASALIQQCELQVQDWYIQTEGTISCSLYLKVRASNQAAIQMYSKSDYMSFLQEDEKKTGETILVMRKELTRPVARSNKRDKLVSSSA